jgi:hypothetical protein
MRGWKRAELIGYVAVLVACIAAANCQQPPPTQPDISIFNNNQAINQGGSNPGSSPSPGAGGDLPAGSFIRIGMFGQSCPSGVTVPNNGSRQIKIGCTGQITATPKAADGSDLPASVHGPTIAWSVPAGSGVVNVLADSEPFNRSVKCLGAGVFTLAATVKGVTGSADFECISAGSSSEGARALGDGLPFPTPEPTSPPTQQGARR